MKLHRSIHVTGIVLLIITSLNALAAGFSMMVEPSGKDLGMSPETVLQHAPFPDFFIPGITLFTMVGLLSMLAAILAMMRHKNRSKVIMLQGIVLTGWIFFQVIFLEQFNWMHATFGTLGILFFYWGFMLFRENTAVKEHN